MTQARVSEARTRVRPDVWLDTPLREMPVAGSMVRSGRRSVAAATVRSSERPVGATPVAERRTIKITGRGAERYTPAPSARRRPQQRAHERPGFKPDRMALYAVMLGALLILVAVLSAHA
jgi:hypothetical protein